MKDERPERAPLEKILDYGFARGRAERKRVALKCGHRVWIARNSYPRRTRCWKCLKDAQHEWDKRNSCAHGFLGDNRANCKDCRIEQLEADRDWHKLYTRLEADPEAPPGSTGETAPRCIACIIAERDEARAVLEEYRAALEEHHAALEELGRIGWPCRLKELPRLYEEATRKEQ